MVLVVDDDPDIRSLIREVLCDEGFDVQEAANGREALDVIARSRPDLIVLDLMMPVMDGRQFFLAYASEAAGGARAPVLLVSAGSAVRETARELGARHYLTKPFDVDDLVRRVAELTR